MVSIGWGESGDQHDRFNLPSIAYGAGVPQATVDMTVAVPFNDAEAMEHRIVALEKEGRKPACVIMEAAMMNLGVVLPEPGYLDAVREVTSKHGIVLIFDEVKTGLQVAAGGAVEVRRYARPGHPGQGPRRWSADRCDRRHRRDHEGRRGRLGLSSRHLQRKPARCGRCPRQPARGAHPEAYKHLAHLNDLIVDGCTSVIEKYDLPGYAVGIGSKGCVTFSEEPIKDYATYIANQRGDLADLAWLYNMNRGVFMTPGREEEWTLSVTHTDEAINAYVSCFDEMARDLTVG